MRHLMPIVTRRLILRPPMLGDLDSIQTAKEEAWPDLQRWMSWAFDNQRSRHAMEDSIRRVMDYQNQAEIALAGFPSDQRGFRRSNRIARVATICNTEIALRTARSAFSHFVCSVAPGAAPQLENVPSQSRFAFVAIVKVDIRVYLSIRVLLGQAEGPVGIGPLQPGSGA